MADICERSGCKFGCINEFGQCERECEDGDKNCSPEASPQFWDDQTHPYSALHWCEDLISCSTTGKELACSASSAKSFDLMRSGSGSGKGSGKGSGSSCNGGRTGSSSGSISACAGLVTLTALTGTISDGPGNYSACARCKWLIQSTGMPIVLQVTKMDLESNRDLLSVYDGDVTPSHCSPRLVKASGKMVPALLTARSGKMLIVLTSDGSAQKAGFEARYWFLTAAPTFSPTHLSAYNSLMPSIVPTTPGPLPKGLPTGVTCYYQLMLVMHSLASSAAGLLLQ